MSRDSRRRHWLAKQKREQLQRAQQEGSAKTPQIATSQSGHPLPFADRVALVGIAIGCSMAIAALALPFAYPDLFSVNTWRLVLWLSLAILVASVGRLIYDIVREIKATHYKSGRKLLAYLAFGSVLFGIVTWYFWPQDEMDKRLPGFGGYAVLRIFDDPNIKRKYVFNVGSDEGAKVAFYISAADLFTLAVMDVHGESYTLETPMADNKIPLHEFIALFCEIGTTENSTILRIDVNGRQIQRRRFRL